MKKTVLPIVFVVAIIVLILLGLTFLPTKLWIIKSVYFYVVDEIVSVTGFNRQLSGGIVLLLLLPLIWVIPVLFKRTHRNNKLAWATVLIYISVFFISMFFIGRGKYFKHRDKTPLQWYALTDKGLKLYDSPGFDPVSGIELKPVTPDIVRRIDLLKQGDPERTDPETAVWFNPITGEPQLWYCAVEENTFEFFNKPGYHPRTGKDLMPVSREFYTTWQRLQAAVKKLKNTKKTSAPEDVSASKSMQSGKSVKRSAIDADLW